MYSIEDIKEVCLSDYKTLDFFIGKKTYMVGEIAKSYQINEIEIFDKQVEREEKLNQLLNE